MGIRTVKSERLASRSAQPLQPTNGTGVVPTFSSVRTELPSSADVVGLWHTGCAALQLRACAPCQVQITVGPVDPATPALLLTPTLQGGGLELP
jgi:hypothetical protein